MWWTKWCWKPFLELFPRNKKCSKWKLFNLKSPNCSMLLFLWDILFGPLSLFLGHSFLHQGPTTGMRRSRHWCEIRSTCAQRIVSHAPITELVQSMKNLVSFSVTVTVMIAASLRKCGWSFSKDVDLTWRGGTVLMFNGRTKYYWLVINYT